MGARRMPRLARAMLPGALALLVAACTVGPDYRRPDPPASTRYVAGVQPASIGTPGAGDRGFAGVQRFVDADALRADWWAVFANPRLDALIAEALAASPTLDAARARLARAAELGRAGEAAAWWPSATLRAGIERQRIDPAVMGFPQAPNPGPFTIYDVGVDVSYDFDVFGGTRRGLEALAADVDYARYELEAAQRTLAANVVATALRQAVVAGSIATVRDIAAAQAAHAGITRKRYALGAVAAVDVAADEALLAEVEARLPPLEAELARTAHRLAVLAGREPAQRADAPFTLVEFRLPPELPLALPADAIAQRPDLRASEALLQRASAEVGVATANLYPKFMLSGSASSARTSFDDLAHNLNLWSIAFNLAQPLLRWDELHADRRAAIDAYDAARAEHRERVLAALQQVADALRALEADAALVAARARQDTAAARVASITRERHALGGVSDLERIDSERRRLEAALAMLEAEGARLADTAALLDATGGPPLASPPARVPPAAKPAS